MEKPAARRTSRDVGAGAAAILVSSALSAATLACTLLVDTSDLATSGPDGGTPANEGGTEAPDASGDGARVDGAVEPCGADLLYCSSFEDESALAEWRGTNLTAAIDRTLARTGSASLRVGLVDETANGVYFYEGPAIPPPHVFIRTFVRYTQVGQGAFLFHGARDFGDGVQLYVGGDDRFHIQRYRGVDIDTGVDAEAGVWYCVELEIDPKNETGRMWLDDRGPFTVGVSTTEYHDFALVASAPEVKELSFDDVAMATRRIGCGN